MTFYIHPQEPLAPALRRIAHEQIGIAVGTFANDAVPLSEKVHSLRARCKKMRGILRLVRPLIGEALDIEDQNFRAAARLLAGYRDMHVVAETIQSLDGSREAVRAPRMPIPAAAIERSLEIMQRCDDAVDNWPLDIGGFGDLAPGFSHTYQKCLDAWNATLRQPSDANFHYLRKMTKYHWYHVRILERLNKQEIRERRTRLRDLQQTLGNAHDLTLLQAILESQQDLEMHLLQRAITRKRKLYADAMKICADVYATTAEELVADYSRWWQANSIDEQQGRVNCGSV